MKPFRAVIFDMDGVIVNSEPIHERCFYEVLDQIGYGGRHGMRFADYIGRSDLNMWEEFVQRHHPPQSLEELLTRKRDRVIAALRQHRPFFPGVADLIRLLAGRYPLALASGSQHPVISAVLEADRLRERFQVVVSADEVAQGKPAPDIFLLTAQRLGVPAAACVVIEDSKPGVAAGLAAGMQVVALTHTHAAAELSQAHHVVASHAELERLLLPDS